MKLQLGKRFGCMAHEYVHSVCASLWNKISLINFDFAQKTNACKSLQLLYRRKAIATTNKIISSLGASSLTELLQKFIVCGVKLHIATQVYLQSSYHFTPQGINNMARFVMIKDCILEYSRKFPYHNK